MESDKRKKLQDLISGEETNWSVVDMDDGSDLSESALLVRCLESMENQNKNSPKIAEQRNIEYFMSDLRSAISRSQVQSDEELESSGWGNGKGLFQLLGMKVSTLLDHFWGWVIWRFNLLENRDEIISPKKVISNPFNFSKQAFPTIAMIIGIFLVFTILKQDTTNSIDVNTDNNVSVAVESTYNNARRFSYTRDVLVSMAPSTSFGSISDTRIDLHEGNVWLDVDKGGAGFEVQTDFGEIKVTGTSFGVNAYKDFTVIEVIEGTVILNRGLERADLKAGEIVKVDALGIHQAAVRDKGFNRPGWVQAMMVVNPYKTDTHTALLLHLDEVEGTLAEQLPYEHEIVDASVNKFHARTEGKFLKNGALRTGQISSPFIGTEGPNGLITSAYVNADKFSRVFRDRIDEGISINESMFNTKEFTIEAWIKNDNGQFIGEGPGIFRLTDNSSNPYHSNQWINLGLTTSDNNQHQLYISYRKSNSDQDENFQYLNGEPLEFKKDVWYHIALVYSDRGPGNKNDGVIEFYVDSEESQGEASRPGTLVGRVDNVADISPMKDGKDGFYEVGAFVHQNFLNGHIDEFRWSNIARKEFNLSR